jgi:hypothetical protein
MTNGGGQKPHKDEKKAERKEPKTAASKASGQVTRPASGK